MLRFLQLLGMLLFFSKAYAIEVTDLYQAKVVVNSQLLSEKNKALKQAMRQVLLKVGGQEAIFEKSEIQKALKDYQQFIAQFSYQREKNHTVLLAQFDENKINNLFYQAGLPLWGNLRPQVLLWLVEESGLTRNILAESSASPLPLIAQEFSQQRGLPISLPVMDLTDLEALSVADLWGRFIAPIKSASKRYQAEAIVVFRISNSSLLPADFFKSEECDILCQQQYYVLDWRLYTQRQTATKSTQTHRYQGNNKAHLFEQALKDMTQEIYQYYALNVNDSHQIEIEVANIHSLSRYVEVFNFLKNLSSVATVQLVSVKGESRRFRLNLLGSQQTLLASLKLNKYLRQYIDPLNKGDDNNIPVFYWEK